MSKLRMVIVLVFVAFAVVVALARAQSHETYVPPNGFVPDAMTASRIAEAVWIPIYGEANIGAQKPFKATLTGDVWTVSGRELPPGSRGGVAEADISKRDGRILRVIHGK
jgi:hypothetical protein